MTLEEHTLGLGKVIVNLHSLEFKLRAFLWKREGHSSWKFLSALREGDTAPENAFTNYDTLNELIEKYNAEAGESFPELCVDPRIVDLRDAIAHGRLGSDVPQPPLRLLKFSKPAGGNVKVTNSILVDDQWLSAQTTRVRLEIEKVAKALENIG